MDMETAAAAGGAGLTAWQAAALSGAAGWVWAASYFDLTRRTRALAQPWVTRRVHAETPSILRFQRMQHKLLDNFFSVLSCVVSVPFYTGFLPLLFWSGHGKLARQMTLLMAFSDYLGNVLKDVVSAPRPCSPPVRRVTSTQDEKEHAMEYGLPSSHALMTVCLMGYMLHYVLTDGACDSFMITTGLSLAFLQVLLIGVARVYLGMHSLTDVIAGVCLGVVILAFWLVVDDHVDAFVVSGQNVTFFWASLSLLLCVAYPEPEFPTPSFEFHTAFTGVAFGIVYGVQQTYSRFHGPDAPLILSQQLPLLAYVGRVLVGIPTILAVKSCSKALSKWLLPVMCSTLGIPIVSSCYVPALKAPSSSSSKSSDPKQAGYLQKVFSLFPCKAYDVDTGIRFVQYAGLAWSVVDLVPEFSKWHCWRDLLGSRKYVEGAICKQSDVYTYLVCNGRRSKIPENSQIHSCLNRYISPQFVMIPEKSVLEFVNAGVLVTDQKLSSVKEIFALLEKTKQLSAPFRTTAEVISGEALATLAVNKLKGS